MEEISKIDCPACGHSCSKDAAACPSCGHPKPGFSLIDHLDYFETKVTGVLVLGNIVAWAFLSFEKFEQILKFSIGLIIIIYCGVWIAKKVIRWQDKHHL